MKNKARYTISVAAASLLLLAALAGCGGSSGDGAPGATGGAAFTIVWPQPGARLIPAGASSITIEIKTREGRSFTPPRKRTVARPDSLAVFQRLPTGALLAEAAAFPSADGGGTAQARGSVPLEILPDNVTAATLTMGSTIAAVRTPATGTITRGESFSLTATPVDAENNVVLVPPGNLRWNSSNPASVSVSATGVVTGVARGQADITVTETDSGKAARIPIFNLTPQLYVTFQNSGNSSVVTVDTVNGSPLGTSAAGQLRDSQDIAVGAGLQDTLTIADTGNNRIVRLVPGAAAGVALNADPLVSPRGVTLDNNGRVYFTDEGNGPRVGRLDAAGRVTEIPINGISLNRPTGIALDRRDRIYVADRDNDLIFRVNADGTGLAVIGTAGNTGVLSQPLDVAVDDQDRVYVADTGNNRILRVIGMGQASPQMAYLSTFGPGNDTFSAPTGVTVDGAGRVYVVDAGHGRIVRIDDFDSRTAQVFALPAQGSPWGVAVSLPVFLL